MNAMCGIVGGTSHQNIVPILMEGLSRLAYRGYDSVGIAVQKEPQDFLLVKIAGKISELEDILKKTTVSGNTGIGHTRWATHGKPTRENAHPHVANNTIILVHNGIIENFEELKTTLADRKYQYLSDTDSELIAFCILDRLSQGNDFLTSVHVTTAQLKGSYAFCAMSTNEPNRIIGARKGPPLIVGIGEEAHFLSSDVLAMQSATDRFIYLEDGDIVDITPNTLKIYDRSLQAAERRIHKHVFTEDAADKGSFPHFMLKEVYEQPDVLSDTLEAALTGDNEILESAFGNEASKIFDKTNRVQFIACGTSFHAGMIGKLWLEEIAGIHADVEIASEFRYRRRPKEDGHTLLVSISQSGETADTLAAIRSQGVGEFLGPLTICNVNNSSLVRESKLVFLTHAGPEIGVCSTKAFTCQLFALFLLTLVLARRHGLNPEKEKSLIQALKTLPRLIQEVLENQDHKIKEMAALYSGKNNSIFLGRGLLYPIAMEGALKLKEISYIHAEAFAAGELKHGTLALVDRDMLLVSLAPNDRLLEKLKSNLHEVLTRDGEIIVFAAKSSHFKPTNRLHVVEIPEVNDLLAPILYAVPLQLLAYHVADMLGKNVDQPRNLAKSVTVE